jgi:ribonuclease HII
MPDFFLENQYQGHIAGVDEAGRGPIAGPVVAAATVFLSQNISEIEFIDQLNDSKKISKNKREVLCQKILDHPKIISAYQIISNQRIDEINILNATREAMQGSILKIASQIDIELVLVDGSLSMLAGKFKEQPIVKGDLKSNSIAAASIIAKVKRDEIMTCLAEEFPQYNWHKNAGYPTKEHLELINKLGVTQHHRQSFAPIRKILKVA